MTATTLGSEAILVAAVCPPSAEQPSSSGVSSTVWPATSPRSLIATSTPVWESTPRVSLGPAMTRAEAIRMGSPAATVTQPRASVQPSTVAGSSAGASASSSAGASVGSSASSSAGSSAAGSSLGCSSGAAPPPPQADAKRARLIIKASNKNSRLLISCYSPPKSYNYKIQQLERQGLLKPHLLLHKLLIVTCGMGVSPFPYLLMEQGVSSQIVGDKISW